jgi:ABC-type thiamine transport system ATPase subunit
MNKIKIEDNNTLVLSFENRDCADKAIDSIFGASATGVAELTNLVSGSQNTAIGVMVLLNKC